MKKFAILSLVILAFVLICGVSCAEVVDSGTCGEHLTWSLEDNGRLTISGTGAMTDFSFIGAPWYSKRDSIKSAEISSGVTSIGDNAFQYCSDLTGITIPNGVMRIGENAFQDCSCLKSITIPSSVASIGGMAFYNCSSLTDITIPDGVRSIGENAFFCSGLKSITIPSSVTSIEGSVFSGCTNLVSIEVASGNTKYAAADGVLFNKNRDKLIVYPAGRVNTTYKIPDSVTRIGGWAFYDCSRLTSITIPDSVKSIGWSAFDGCKSLASITIPDGVKVIEGYTFTDCRSLANVTIPDSVKSIGMQAFRNCSSLKTVKIPNGVASIEDKTFDGCRRLKRITIPKSVTFIGSDNFSDIIIETPCNSYAADWAEKHSYNDIECIKVHNWKDPAYTWAKDYSTVTAKRVCANDKMHKETETVETTYKVKKEPTYTKKGIGVYTSKAFTVSRAFKVQTKKVTLDMLPRTAITKATVKAIDDQVYTGSAIKPTLTVKFGGKKLVKGTDYTVSFKDNIKPGQATVTITGKNAFKGKTTVTFKILPKKVKLVSVKPGKAMLTVTWKKGTAITGYDIEYSTRRDFSYAVMISVSSKTTLTTKIKHLTPGTTYYVRVRTYKEIGKKTYNSDWSAKMEATVPEE